MNEPQRNYNDINAHTQAPPQPGMVETLRAEISDLRQRLSQSTGELGTIADRLLGTRPTPAPEPRKEGYAAGAGHLAAAHNELGLLAEEIGAIEERVGRLSTL